MILEGSCHCGAVQFKLRSSHPYPFNLCYCSICRKTSGGGGYAINLGGDHETLEVRGEDRIRIYQAKMNGAESPARRNFCGDCGTALWLWDPRWPELVHPFASAIDTELPVPPERTHLMLGSKASWLELRIDAHDKRFVEYPEESIAQWHERLGLVRTTDGDRTDDPTRRFTDRVENYRKYRPSYPRAIIDLLARECGLDAGSVVADIGSGTGIFSGLMLERGCTVYGVEPNAAMRAAAEQAFADDRRFTSIHGAAEQTNLDAGSCDIITASQAFHWFHRLRARREFERILKGRGWVVLIWNDRRTDTPFLARYEELLQHFGIDYGAANHRNISASVIAEFFNGDFRTEKFMNRQLIDYEVLQGRLLSASYAPKQDHPNFQPLMVALARAFREHERGGRISLDHDTRVYYGRFARDA